MDQDKLQEALEELREEINRVPVGDEAARGRLNGLITDIEHGLENPDDGEHRDSILADIKETVAQFELDHPRATGILNHIMVMLGNIGI